MSQNIKLNHITKIEGHASLSIKVDGKKVTVCKLRSEEGARFFEAIIKGRSFNDIPEITTRICGICSCAHLICSLKAIEDAYNITVSKQTKLIRDIISIGERIRSHASHLYFFVIPDYLGIGSTLELLNKKKALIQNAFELIHLGNDLISLFGGKEMHPYMSRVGGQSKIPTKESIQNLKSKIKTVLKFADHTLKLFASLNYPSFKSKNISYTLKSNELPLVTGDAISSTSHSFEKDKYLKNIKEFVVDHSTSKFSKIKNKPHIHGALSRLEQFKTKLTKNTKSLVKKYNIKLDWQNPFHNNIAQAIELYHFIDSLDKILDKYEFKPEPIINYSKLKPKKHGIGCVEAPRGTLFHDYTFDSQGKVKESNIITPTCQNQLAIETDIKHYTEKLILLGKTKDEIKFEIEKLIRSFDPCFSCSTHFLDLRWL